MDIGTLVNQFGLPVGLLLYFIWRDYQTSKEHKADMRDVATKSVLAINEGTDAIKSSTETLVKNNDFLSNNSDILNEVKGVLSSRGAHNNGSGSGN